MQSTNTWYTVLKLTIWKPVVCVSEGEGRGILNRMAGILETFHTDRRDGFKDLLGALNFNIDTPDNNKTIHSHYSEFKNLKY